MHSRLCLLERALAYKPFSRRMRFSAPNTSQAALAGLQATCLKVGVSRDRNWNPWSQVKEGDLRGTLYRMALRPTSQKVGNLAVHTRASGRGPCVYPALNERTSQIYIFTRLPAMSKRAALEGLLRVEQLSDEPQYEGVSYVWASTPTDSTIYVNDCELLVGWNLFEALLELRHSTKSRRIWIDTISIDQANVLERNHQINQMCSIYGTASRVLI
jgi:hypothetical protein